MKVSILGCGWLGLPLAERLAADGHAVSGSTTTPEKLPVLEAAGVEPYLLRLDPHLEGERTADFFDADVLFVNVPPGRRRPDVEEHHLAQIDALCGAIAGSRLGWVVFASSTSVYPDLNRVVEEEDAVDPPKASGRALLEAEARLGALDGVDLTVLRFAGLYGYDRKAGRFLAGKTGLSRGGAPVNLIHRDDAVCIVLDVLAQDVRGEVLNACSDAHPPRAVFYRHAAERGGWPPPTFADEDAGSFKIVGNRRLKERLDFSFLYPDPMDDAP